MDLADLVGFPRIEEDALGERGLAGIDMRHDADIAGAGYGKFTGHIVLPQVTWHGKEMASELHERRSMHYHRT